MEQSFFTIAFKYELIPASLHVHLCADIEMIDSDACVVRNIRRDQTEESPLLPELKLKRSGDIWVHMDSEKESNISRIIGEAVDLHLKQTHKKRDELKNR